VSVREKREGKGIANARQEESDVRTICDIRDVCSICGTRMSSGNNEGRERRTTLNKNKGHS